MNIELIVQCFSVMIDIIIAVIVVHNQKK